ncbi:hypothetical protein Ancab_022025 [Ancistrocladus abbreviatus]
MTPEQTYSDNTNGYVQRRPRGLVVDCERISRMIHTGVLRACNVEAECIETGTDALDPCVSRSRFFVIIIDISCPDTLPVEVTRTLHAMDRSTAIIGITPDNQHGESQAILYAGGFCGLREAIDPAPTLAYLASVWSLEKTCWRQKYSIKRTKLLALWSIMKFFFPNLA